MAPPPRARPLRKDMVASVFKPKAITFSETFKPSSLAPNIRSISWSPTGSLVGCATTVYIRVWNPERADVKASTELKDGIKGGAHGGAVERVVFCPTREAVLASCGQDGLVKLWDVRLPGAAGMVGAGPKGSVTSKSGDAAVGGKALFLTWHPNGTELLVGRADDVVTALDVRKADIPIIETAINPASTTYAPKYDLDAIDRTPPRDLFKNAEGKGNLNAMAFSNTGRELFATTSDGPVHILDYPTLEPLHTLRGHTSNTYVVQQSPTGAYVALGASDSLVTLWDTSSFLCTHVLTRQTSSVRDISFSFDGAYLVAGSGAEEKTRGDPEKGLHIYHVDSGEEVHTVETTNAPTYVAWHPLKYAVAYAGDPGGLKVVGGLG